MFDVPGLNLEQLAATDDEATFAIVVDGVELGEVTFAAYYQPRAAALGTYVALWAGPTLCVIDRRQATMRSIHRRDETHRVHPFDDAWIIEGELNIDLFDPRSLATLATYGHDEVIVDSEVVDGLVHIEDFAGVTVILDPRRSLEVVQRPGA